MEYTPIKSKRWRTILPVLVVGILILLTHHFSCAAANHSEAAIQLPAPLFTPAGGLYTNSVSVHVKATAPAAKVRYTLDGSEPTGASPECSGSIEINADTLLKVKAFDASGAGAATVAQAYTIIDSGLVNFSSNLPLIILDSFGQRIGREPRVPISVRFIDPKGGRSRLAGSGDFSSLADLNVRGNTSLRYPKKSYHLKLMNEAHETLKGTPLGFTKESDWVLYAPYVDKTLMRDVLGYELSNEIGRYAAKTRFVEVFVNESNGKLTHSHYRGVYVFEEKIKRSKNRIPIEKLTPEDNTEPNVTGGFIIKKDHTERADAPEGFIPMISEKLSARQQRFVSSQGSTFFYVDPKPTEITAPQKAWIRRYVNTFEKTLYGENFRDPKTGYAAYIDVDSFIDHHWLVELSKNIDGFRFSTFYYKDRGGKLCMGPIWDWNLTFGNPAPRDGSVPEGWYWPQLDDQQYSWFRRLFEDPDFAQRYADRWGELRTKQFSVTNIHNRIDQMAALLNEAQARNFKKWHVMGEHVWPNGFVGQSFDEEIDYMKTWTEKRIRWIDRQFLKAPILSLPSGPLERGSKLELKGGRPGDVYYTLDGTDPRASGGEVSSSAHAYKEPIVINNDTAVVCRVRQNNRWSPPATMKIALGKSYSGYGK